MSPKIIRDSFAVAAPIGDQVVDKFYEIFFKDHPEVKEFFPKDMKGQKKALLNSLVFIVDNIEKPNALIPYLKQMGSRHVGYEVKDHFYDYVGSALLKTFAHFFKEKWTPELKKEWTEAYGVIAKTMLEGAKEKRAKKTA